MAKEMENTEIEEFMNGPLVTWFKNCLNSEEKLTYESLVDGVLIHNVFLQMGLDPVSPETILPSAGNIQPRQRNLRCILANLQAGLVACGSSTDNLESPDVVALGREPELHISEAKRLLLLLLGCAVQCPNRSEFEHRLDESTQAVLSVCIAQIMRHAAVQEASHEVSQILQEQDCRVKRYKTPRKERAVGLKRYGMQHSTPRKDVDEQSRLDEDELSISVLDSSVRSVDEEELRKREAELLEWKSRVRSQQEELKECADDLTECREELAECKGQLVRLQRENERLALEARNAKSYRDELDVANEKAERADRLEQDIVRYKERLASIDFYKSRLDELREDNRLLMENKEMLVEQARAQRAKAEKARLEYEKQIFELKEKLEELAQEGARSSEKYRELCEENAQLERLVKSSTSEALESGFIVDSDDSAGSLIAIDNSLSEQLTNAAQSKALKLELENRRLSTLVDSLTECSLHESSTRLHDLENDKLRADVHSLARRNAELEASLKKTLDDNERLQQQLSRELGHKCDDLEKHQLAALIRDKKHLQTLLDSAQKRARELERSLTEANRELDERKAMKDTMNETRIRQKELELRIALLEKERQLALEEADRQRELAREARLALETSSKLARELERRLDKLERRNDDSRQEVAKLEEIYNMVKYRKTAEDSGKDETKLQSLIEAIEEQNQLKLTNSQLAAEKSILLKSREKLSSDQEQLKALYEQLNADYQQGLQERKSLSSQLREAKLKLRRQHESIESLETSCRSLEGECQDLKSSGAIEHLELKEDFSQLFKSNEALMAEHRRIKTELADGQSELKAKTTRVAELELETGRLEQRCEILGKMNQALEADKRSLMEHVSQLLKQNHELISQMLEDREHYHMEERKNNDKVMHLRRQKEKLEEKIMEHYRRLDNCPASRKSKSLNIVNNTFFKKMRRAGSELFSRSRRSWAEDSSSGANASSDFEYVRGHESDHSFDSSRRTPQPRYLEIDEQLVGLKNPRQARVSDFGLGWSRSRMSIDALNDFLDEGLSKPRSRKTIDFLGIFENAADMESELDRTLNDDLDRTLNDDSVQLAGKGDEEVFSIKKPVDLSFEEEQASTSSGDPVEDNNNDRNSSNNNFDDSINKGMMKAAAKPRQETWHEYGCA